MKLMRQNPLSTYRNNPEHYTEASYKNVKTGQTLATIGLVLFVLAIFVVIGNS
jgi:hypothetical protein